MMNARFSHIVDRLLGAYLTACRRWMADRAARCAAAAGNDGSDGFDWFAVWYPSAARA
ncbi:hypothetical protein [Bifidobacterium avesanii]|uniref:hypothetical protein n=1 Tax=Bifidobacterium avesanii TaxID=1798157 RepID=UPI001382A59B|nr:hypothetical protein [Bifidobacterium avesanii]KAB8292786.1 hypothetical protein DSM100685_0797 [Bifidobacterium avesanii]